MPSLVFALFRAPDGGAMLHATRVTLSMILTLLSSVALDVAVTDKGFRQLRGESASLSDSIRVGRARLPAALVVSVPTALSMYLSAVLPSGKLGLTSMKLVPLGAAIAISVVLFVAVPVVVIEKLSGMTALRRAALLAKGHRWGLFWVPVLLVVVEVLADILVKRLVHVGTPRDFLAANSSGALAWVTVTIAAFFAPLAALFAVVAYHDLRSLREDRNISEVASVFD